MNYEDMSDFEINSAVATNESLIINERQSKSKHPTAVMVNDIVQSFMFDPCNSPSDAWPIIVENKIGVTPATVRSNRNKDLWIASPDWTFETPFDTNHKNPLRAAMICFLKMKDTENGR